MKHIKGTSLLSGWSDAFRNACNAKDIYGRGRLFMLISTLISCCAGSLYTGVFNTKFLLISGIDQTGVGILTLLPYLGCIVSIFSPYIIEHFPRRKPLILIWGLVSNFFSILGITMLPLMVEDVQQRLYGFVIITVAVNLIGNLFSAATGAWDAMYIKEESSTDYFAISNMLSSFVTWSCALAVSLVADMFSGTEMERKLIIGIRIAAWILMVISTVVSCMRKEFPYAQKEKPKISNIFILPLKHREYRGTMIILFLFYFIYHLPDATLNVYLLEDVGVKYTLINGINMLYVLYLIVFSNMWTRLIKRHGGFTVLAIGLLMECVTNFAYSFVTADRIWLYTAVRLTQHFTGIPLALVSAAFIYMNLPEEDQSYYVTFAVLVRNVAMFLTTTAATVFTELMGTNTVSVFGESFVSNQVLLFACGAGKLLLAAAAVFAARKLTKSKTMLR